MEFDYDYWTNNKAMFQDANLENKKILLLHSHEFVDIETFKKIPAWHFADKIFIVGQESEFADYVFADQRVHVWDSIINLDYPRYNHYFFWWHNVKEIEYYENNLSKLANPLNNSSKKVFEYLIGSTNRAPQRNFIKKLILENNLEDYFYHNFDGEYIPGADIDNGGSMQIVYNTVQTSNRSSVLPYKIYNQSWFSVVSESLGHKRFFTEKTAKVLLGKRLFIMIGSQYALRDLHYLGFKTFSNILDESYDSIENDYQRWGAAFDQIKYICQHNPEKLYQKVLPILEHNQKTFLKQNWLKNTTEQMKQISNSS